MKDVDRGWAWVVLAASFVAYFISCGLFYNIGIYFVTFLDAFNESRSYTAWVGALLSSMFHIAGPLSSLILPYVGARGILLLGGCFMGFGYAILYFSQSILYIIVFYGLFGGIGCFFVISGCLTAVANYFCRRLYLAAGIMSAGGGLGTIAIGISSETFIAEYGWRGSLLLMSAIALQICVCACLVFDQKKKQNKDDDDRKCPNNSPPEGGRFHFLSDSRFWFLSVGAMSMNFAGFSLYVFLKDIMLSKRLAPDYREFVIWLGLGSAVGRAICGFMATQWDPLLYYFGVGTLCAADILLMAYARTQVAFYTLGCLFGACHGQFCVLQSIKIAHVYGREHMAVIWGFAMSLGSLGVLAGPPIGGFIADKTGNYDGTLVLYGAATFVSGTCALAAFFVHRQNLKKRPMSVEMTFLNGEASAEEVKSMLTKPIVINEEYIDQCPELTITPVGDATQKLVYN